jgi:hypothetical protein
MKFRSISWRYISGNRWIRVTTLAAVLLGAVSVLSYRSARARTGEALAELGDQLMRIPAGTFSNDVHRVNVNGFTMRIQTGVARVPFDQVVQQYEAECLSRGGMQNPELGQAELAKLRGEVQQEDARMLDGVFVQTTEKGTVVACIDTHGVPWLSHDMVGRVKRFGQNGNLSEIGTFRYALVKQREYGAHVVTMSTGDSAPVLKMFPKTGDAPGPDHLYVPRLAGSRRVLSVETHDLQMVAYEHSNQRLLDVITDTEKQIRARGLGFKDMDTQPPGAHFWVTDGDKQAMVTLSERNGRVFTLISDAPQ